MGLFKNLFATKNENSFKELINRGAVILDVRTPAEYKTGHIAGSVNIDLANVNASLPSLKKINKPFIAVCRSGNRSDSAVNLLKQAGMEAYNGGAWNDLQRKIA